MKSICIFEDKGYSKLLPIVYTRPVYELRCGIDLLINKIIRQYPDTKINLFLQGLSGRCLKNKIFLPH